MQTLKDEIESSNIHVIRNLKIQESAFPYTYMYSTLNNCNCF